MRLATKLLTVLGGRSASPLLTNLISYWELNETSGTRYDAHGTNHLTDNNTVGYAAGVVGNAASFVGANNEYLKVDNNASLETGDIDFTVGGWIRLSSKAANAGMISKFSYGTREDYVAYYSVTTDRLRFMVGNGTTSHQSLSADQLGSPSLDTWYFLVGWHDATANTINIQVNDGAVDSASTTITLGASDLYLTFGNYGSGYLTGYLDTVALWKRVLTADERTWLYNSGAGRSYADILAYRG